MSDRDSQLRLIADIGGTHARFALETAPGVLEDIDVMPCAAWPTLEAALREYLARTGTRSVAHAAIGIANPVTSDWVQMTNHHWAFSIEATREALGLTTLLVINDFTALALALPELGEHELVQIGGVHAEAGSPIALLGPGTGLGVSALIPHADGFTPLAGEGGHVSFAPFDEREAAIWRYARDRFGHVSAERLLSGPGLSVIHQALCDLAGEPCEVPMTAAQITEFALVGHCARCRETLDAFTAMLGTAAANLALTLGSRGGVYLGGGILPRMLDYFKTSPFRARFEDKGRFSGYLAAIPVYVITARYPALTGASAALSLHLEKHHA